MSEGDLHRYERELYAVTTWTESIEELSNVYIVRLHCSVPFCFNVICEAATEDLNRGLYIFFISLVRELRTGQSNQPSGLNQRAQIRCMKM